MTGNATQIVEWLMSQDKENIYDIDIHRNKRSLNANGMLWECLGQMAEKLKTDKWELYRLMLKRYGQFTYVCIKPDAAEMFKRTWRDYEELGEVDINGQTSIQFLVYFGSSDYNSKEFSHLLDGVISEMKEIGLTPPPTKEMQRVIEMLEKREKRNDDKDKQPS